MAGYSKRITGYLNNEKRNPGKYYGDDLVRSFRSGNGPLKWDDPTYTTFALYFHFFEYSKLNVIKPGLLLPWNLTDFGSNGSDVDGDGRLDGDLESAIFYLHRINEPERAKYLSEFRWLLETISHDYPWSFHSISGLNELWKLEEGQNFRGKDKVITVECQESMDFRMTALIDLYRKAVWDAQYHRLLLPKSKRRFNCEVLVFDWRKFVTYSASTTSLHSGPPIPYDLLPDPPVAIDGEEASPYRDEPHMEWLRNSTSVVRFILEDCEFDFSEAPMFDALMAAGSTEPAMTRFKIKVGRIREHSTYSLLQYLISDDERLGSIQNGFSGVHMGKPIDDLEPLVKPTPSHIEDYVNVNRMREQDRKELTELNMYGSSGGLVDKILSGEAFTEEFLSGVLNKHKDNLLREVENFQKNYLSLNERNVFEAGKLLGINKLKGFNELRKVYEYANELASGNQTGNRAKQLLHMAGNEVRQHVSDLLEKNKLTEKGNLKTSLDIPERLIGGREENPEDARLAEAAALEERRKQLRDSPPLFKAEPERTSGDEPDDVAKEKPHNLGMVFDNDRDKDGIPDKAIDKTLDADGSKVRDLGVVYQKPKPKKGPQVRSGKISTDGSPDATAS
jgi:hypothetical protein